MSYQGPITTTLKLHFHAIPSVFENLLVGESLDIKHSFSTFQKNIVIDSNKERLSVSFKVRTFFGATDFCKFGGLRMFNHLYAAVNHNQIYGAMQAEVPYHNTKHSSHIKFLKQSKYFPICTNDSLIFQRKFFLDFGKTYFVFYDFNSIWNIDITLSVHSSNYHALYNFEESYCSNNIEVYMFNGFFINCKLATIKLTHQVPVILQWARDISPVKKKRVVNIGCIWPGRMDLVIDQNYRNLKIFDDKSKMCTPISILQVIGPTKGTSVLLGTNTQNQSVPDAVSLIVATVLGNQCPYMDQSSYAIVITPLNDGSHCISSHSNFSEDSPTARTNVEIITEGCVSLDAIMKKDSYVLYIMEPYYNFPLYDKWIYYSLIISEGCYRGTGMKVYFHTITFQQKQQFYFKFSQQQYHYIWYDYGVVGILQFYIERFLLNCAAYIEVTSSPHRQNLLFHNRHHFKVTVKNNL